MGECDQVKISQGEVAMGNCMEINQVFQLCAQYSQQNQRGGKSDNFISVSITLTSNQSGGMVCFAEGLITYV